MLNERCWYVLGLVGIFWRSCWAIICGYCAEGEIGVWKKDGGVMEDGWRICGPEFAPFASDCVVQSDLGLESDGHYYDKNFLWAYVGRYSVERRVEGAHFLNCKSVDLDVVLT